MPKETLLAFDAHGRIDRTLPRDGGDGDETVAAYGRAGIDVMTLASELQVQGAKSFDDSWQDLLDAIGTKSQALA
jgi:transaldolase